MGNRVQLVLRTWGLERIFASTLFPRSFDTLRHSSQDRPWLHRALGSGRRREQEHLHYNEWSFGALLVKSTRRHSQPSKWLSGQSDQGCKADQLDQWRSRGTLLSISVQFTCTGSKDLASSSWSCWVLRQRTPLGWNPDSCSSPLGLASRPNAVLKWVEVCRSPLPHHGSLCQLWIP